MATDVRDSANNSHPFERGHTWIGLLGVWLGLLAAGLYFNTIDTTLRRFTGRIIGQAVVFGLDPALRIRAYVVLCAVSLGVAALVIITLYRLQAWAAERGHRLLDRSEEQGAALLALVGIGDLLLGVLNAAPAYRNGALFLLLCTALLAAAPLLRLVARARNRPPWARALGSPLTQGAILLLAYQVSTGVGVLMELPLLLGVAALARFVVTWLVLQAGVGMLAGRGRSASGTGAVTARLLRAGIPLLWLPAVGPLANELQYTLRTHVAWTPLALARVMAFGLAAVTVVRGFRGAPPAVSARGVLRLLQRWYIPIVLVSSMLLTLHRQTMTIDVVDAYHHGEMTTPVMEILQHGRLPYLETCLPHGFMDLVPQIFFAAINGSTTWDMLIWGSGHWAGWLTLTAGLALVYALLVTVASPLAALLVVLFLPVELLVSLQYAPLILCVLALQALLRHHGARRAWMLPASVLAAFLWRVDFGMAALTAAAATLVAVAWSCRRLRWIPLLVASGAIVVGVGTLGTALALARHVAIGDTLHTFLTYVSMQITAASYYDVYDKMSALVVLQYVLLPAIGLLIVLWCGVRAVLVRRCEPASVYRLLFLAVLSLVFFVRSLQRHSLIEGVFSPHLFLFLLAALPTLAPARRRSLVAVLLVVVAVGAALGLPDARLLAKDVKWPAIAGGPSRFAFRTWEDGDRRVIVLDAQTDDVVRVLRAQLKPGQTFYDFANAPLLYFLTGAPPPSYIIDSSYYIPDDLQHALIQELDTLRRADRLPLIVFRQHTAFDAVDGIADEVRSYRVAEYLYAHYVPWANAGRFELWIDKRLVPSAATLETGLEGPVVATYPLALRPPSAAANVTAHTTDIGGVTLAASGEPAWVEGLFVLPAQVVWRPGLEYHLHLRYTTSTPAIIRTVFSFTDPAGGTHSSAEVVAVPTANDRPADLHVPLRLGSTQPPALTGIRLLLPGNATLSIAAAELEVRQRPPGAAAAWAWSPVGEPYPQRFDLFRLPNIWANLDAHDPVHTARELQTLHAGDAIAVAPGHDHVFSVQPVDMASGQYLHLRMQADTPATVTVGYGDATHPNTFSMQVQASPEPQDYLIRLSTQWEWERGTVTALRLSASAPVRLDALRVLAGD